MEKNSTGKKTLPTQTPNLPRETALNEVTRILEKKVCNFDLVPFEQFNRKRQLRSQKYKPFLVLCHKNTLRCAGWLLCKFVLTGGCPLRSGLIQFSVSAGGTGKFDRHMMNHSKPSINTFPRILPPGGRSKVARAAAIAVALDHRPISFTDKKKGMSIFAETLFKAGQTFSCNDNIDPASLLPCAKTVTKELEKLAEEVHYGVRMTVLPRFIASGGAITTDGTTLKVQDKQFYDMTLHYICVRNAGRVREPVELKLECHTIMLKEKTGAGNAQSLRALLNDGIMVYDKTLIDITKNAALVTDCASVMARVAGSSVSSQFSNSDPKWMGCLAHQLNTAMKHCIEKMGDSPIIELRRIAEDLRRVKTIVRIFKQGGWNASMQSGFRLIQEAETRFGTTLSVVKRFLKSANLVENMIVQKNSEVASSSFAGLLRDSNNSGGRMGFPGLEAIVDAFDPIIEVQVAVQASTHPTIHTALPMVQSIYNELERVSGGGSVVRNDARGTVPAPSFSKHLCRSIKEWLEAKVRIHDLWLVGCFLHPFLREFQMVPSWDRREEYKRRAEQLIKTLIVDSEQEAENTLCDAIISPNDAAASLQSQDSESFGPGKKRKFNLLSYADTHFTGTTDHDEIYKYNALNVGVLIPNKKKFMKDSFSAIRFWYERKSTFPNLYNVAFRVFATPLTSCASERVFSGLKKDVGNDRSNLTAKHIEHLTLVRSLFSTIE